MNERCERMCRLWPDQDDEGSDTNRQRATKEARINFLCVHTNDVRSRQTLMKMICVDATTNNKGQRWLHLRMQLIGPRRHAANMALSFPCVHGLTKIDLCVCRMPMIVHESNSQMHLGLNNRSIS